MASPAGLLAQRDDAITREPLAGQDSNMSPISPSPHGGGWHDAADH